MTYKKLIEDLEKEIRYFEKCLRDWNNKRLDQEIRQKAEDECHRLTDLRKDSESLKAKLSALKQARQITLKEELEFLEEEYKELKEIMKDIKMKTNIANLICLDSWNKRIEERIKKIKGELR